VDEDAALRPPLAGMKLMLAQVLPCTTCVMTGGSGVPTTTGTPPCHSAGVEEPPRAVTDTTDTE